MKIRFQIILTALISSSIILTWGTAFTASDVLGNLQWLLYGAGLSSLSVVFLFKRNQRSEDARISEQLTAIESGQKALAEQEKQFRQTKKELEDELQKRSVMLLKREQQLTQQLITWHEWMEFPKDIEDPDDAEEEIITVSELQKQDQEVLELLEKSIRVLFDKIKYNKYYEDEEFRKNLLLDDILDLIESVAKVYKPDSENPLIETSIENLLRALNRISLQLLVLLEQLPLNLKEYNLKKTYENIQTGVKAYDVYKSAEPYLTFAKPVYYLGRFALGANPVTMGVGWAVGEIFKKGTRKLSSHLANQYALNFLHDLVFIIGNEAAGIFGGDYRRRENNWIYGAELTELVHRFPVSRETLLCSFNEIGLLRLRSEYDRIFFYRCLAARKSACPERFESSTWLSSTERQTIANRLEHFFERYIYGKQKDMLEWKTDAEERLGVKLSLDEEKISLISDRKKTKPTETVAKQALRSLASFLLDIKACNTGELPALLSDTHMAGDIEESKKSQELEAIMNNPPMIFDYPDMEPSDKLLDDYLKDLMTLAVKIFPHDNRGDLVVEEAAHYFRRKDLNSLQKDMDKMYADFLAQRLAQDSPEKKLKPHIARDLLACLEQHENPVFVFEDIEIEISKKKLSLLRDKELLLMGTDTRLMLFAAPSKKKHPDDESVFLWSGTCSGESNVSAECIKSRLNNDCRLKGGTWHSDAIKELKISPGFKLSGKAMTRYETYFRMLLEFCGTSEEHV
ncbi:MAG: hypothetical protein GY749_13060 [Desulfobacteraceae bacterium]|nr:hypothetical protein [Desulfobacteraceae bacterium]